MIVFLRIITQKATGGRRVGGELRVPIVNENVFSRIFFVFEHATE